MILFLATTSLSVWVEMMLRKCFRKSCSHLMYVRRISYTTNSGCCLNSFSFMIFFTSLKKMNSKSYLKVSIMLCNSMLLPTISWLPSKFSIV